MLVIIFLNCSGQAAPYVHGLLQLNIMCLFCTDRSTLGNLTDKSPYLKKMGNERSRQALRLYCSAVYSKDNESYNVHPTLPNSPLCIGGREDHNGNNI